MKTSKRKTYTAKELLHEAELFNLKKKYHEITRVYIEEIEERLIKIAKEEGKYIYAIVFTQNMAYNLCNYKRDKYNQMYLGSIDSGVLNEVLTQLREYFTNQGFFVGMENLGSREDQKFVVSCLPILSAVSKN